MTDFELFMQQQSGGSTPALPPVWQALMPAQQSTAQQAPIAPMAPRKVAAPMAAVAPGMSRTLQRSVPVSNDVSDMLLGRINAAGLKSRAEQESGMNEISNLIADYETRPLPSGFQAVDLTPFAGIVDSLTGSNLSTVAKGLKKAETADERQAKVLGLKQISQKQKENLTDKDIDLLKMQYQHALAKETLKSKDAKQDLNVFEQEEAKSLAKQSSDWSTKDKAQIQNSVSKINEAISLMDDPKKNISGPGMGWVPGKELFFPDAAKAKADMDSAIADTLRPTLGAQFTEAEGERIKKLTFNPSLSQEVNSANAKVLKGYMQRKVQANDALYAHMRQYGSSRGFDFSKYGMSGTGGDSAGSAPAAPKIGDIVDGGRYKGGDPSNPSSWEIAR